MPGIEGFHRQCQVLTMASLAQIVNVLHAPVMTDGARMWLTPTYHALRLHAPHIGATALPVEVEQAESLPDGTAAVSATASRTGGGVAVALINWHYDKPASVRLSCADAPERASGQLLAADTRARSTAPMRPIAWRRGRSKRGAMEATAGGSSCRRTRWRRW